MSDINTQRIRGLVDQIENAKETEARINRLFDYDTAEEQESKRPGTERIDRCDATIEIGGGAAHAKLYGLSREEIDGLRPILVAILQARSESATEALNAEFAKKE